MKRNMGDLLVDLKFIDAMQLRAILGHHKRWGTPIGRIAVELGFCTWKHVLYALSLQTGMPAVDLDVHRGAANLAHVIPEKIARKLKVVPLARQGQRKETIVVAIAAPARLETLDVITQVTGKRVQAYIAADHALERELDRIYSGKETALVARHSAHAPLQEREFDLDAA